ncbi:MAG: hypothetical protein ACRD8A_12155 [Candidatus Acidiferrales bacterium]
MKTTATCAKRLIGKGPVWITCTLAALGMTICSPASRGQAGPAPNVVRRAPLQTMGAPAATQGTIAHRGTVQGVVFWDSRRVAYSPSGSCQGLQISLGVVNGTGAQSLGSTTQLQVKPPTQPASSIYQCGFSFTGVPEGITLQVQLTIGQPFASQVGSVGPFKGATAFEIPGGTCSNPSPAPNFESGWQSCGENLTNVNFQLVPRSMAQASPAPSALLQQTPHTLLPAQPQSATGASAPTHGLLLPAVNGGPVMSTPSAQPATGGTSGANTRMLNPQPYPPKAAPNVSGSANPAAAVQMPLAGAKLVVPSNLKVFTVGEARNSAVAAMLTPASAGGAGGIGAGHTMSATGNGGGLTTSRPVVQESTSRPGMMQPKSGIAGVDRLSPNASSVCLGPPSIAAVNKNRFTQFTPGTPGTHYVITGCGFGSTPGSVYLSAPFPAHNGRLDLGPYWAYGTERTWTGHWSDKVIDAQLDGLSGEQDEDNVVLVVQTSNGQQIQMNDVSFKAQRLEVMLKGSPLGSSWQVSGFGTGVSPCGAWITSNCTLEVLRNYYGTKQTTPDTYTVTLKPGFVVSRAVLLVMSQASVTNYSSPQVNGNQVTVNWDWTTDKATGFTYSMYGLQIFVVGPSGVTDPWVKQ